MSVNDGNPANAATFNSSFLSKEVDDETVGVLGLNNTTDVNSGNQIVNSQRLINEIADSDGNAGEGDATAKTYSSTTVVANGDDRKVAIGKLDAGQATINTTITNKFDGTTGHSHDGTAGEGPKIDAENLDNFNNFFAEFQDATFDAANGNSTDVSATFAAKSSGGAASTEGVITSNPDNRVEIVGKDDYREIEDTSGRRVYGRLTEAAATWTLTYYVNIAGTETAHSLSSQNIRYLYREVFDGGNRPTITPSLGLFDSLSAVEDIPDATTTQAGKVSTGAQTFGGNKDFNNDLTKGGIAVVTISDAQVITNKDIDGGTAANNRRVTLPADTLANLNALTRKAGTVVYGTDTQVFYGDNGTTLNPIGGIDGIDDLSDVTVSAPANGEVLIYNNGTSQWENSTIPTSVLNDLTDVTIAGPVNNEILIYNNGTSQWENATFPTSALNDLTDVTITAVADGNILQYNNGTSQWENVAFPIDVINDLSDVTITAVADGEALIYNNGTSQWENTVIPNPALNDITDVAITAPANGEVLTYNSGSGDWENAAPSGGGGGGIQVAYVKDVKSSGTAGGTFTSGSYQTRTLNTLEDPDGIVTSLSSNQFVLPAGDYEIQAEGIAHAVFKHKMKIRNITDSTDDVIGLACEENNVAFQQGRAGLMGRVSIAGSKTFELQHRCVVTRATDGYGFAAGFGDDEVYAIVKITKV